MPQTGPDRWRSYACKYRKPDAAQPPLELWSSNFDQCLCYSIMNTINQLLLYMVSSMSRKIKVGVLPLFNPLRHKLLSKRMQATGNATALDNEPFNTKLPMDNYRPYIIILCYQNSFSRLESRLIWSKYAHSSSVGALFSPPTRTIQVSVGECSNYI